MAFGASGNGAVYMSATLEHPRGGDTMLFAASDSMFAIGSIASNCPPRMPVELMVLDRLPHPWKQSVSSALIRPAGCEKLQQATCEVIMLVIHLSRLPTPES